MTDQNDNVKQQARDKEKDEDVKLAPLLAVVKKLGYVPYVLVCLGILTALYAGKVPSGDTDVVKRTLKLLSAALFVSGILWSLIRLFQRLFIYRPARGLIDGLLCGIIAGFIGGTLGYGAHPTATSATFERAHDGSSFLIPTNYVDPSYLRILWALVVTVPIAGLLGLGCDLIHTDRRINWRRDLAIVLLVGAVVLLLVGFGIFRYVPLMDGKGITFSEILLPFEIFLLAFCSMMAWTFRWPLKKFIGRFTLVLLLVACSRIITRFMTTTDPEQRGLPLWSRQYITLEGVSVSQGQYEMAQVVCLFCIWTVLLYGVFYCDNSLSKRIDRLVQSILR